jgi:hypothetical protein
MVNIRDLSKGGRYDGMGVMLALDGSRSRLRRRGQHARTPEEQACLDAFAAFLRYDAPGAGRSLSRLATTVLAGRLLPAARALADAADLVLAQQPLAAPVAAGSPDSGPGPGPAGDSRTIALNVTVSPACLLGMCRRGGCASPLCEHACHSASA